MLSCCHCRCWEPCQSFRTDDYQLELYHMIVKQLMDLKWLSLSFLQTTKVNSLIKWENMDEWDKFIVRAWYKVTGVPTEWYKLFWTHDTWQPWQHNKHLWLYQKLLTLLFNCIFYTCHSGWIIFGKHRIIFAFLDFEVVRNLEIMDLFVLCSQFHFSWNIPVSKPKGLTLFLLIIMMKLCYEYYM